MAKDGLFVKMQGERELKMMLSKYGASFDKKFWRNAIGHAARPATKAAKQATVEGPTGNLKRSIGFKFINKSRYPNFTGWVGARMGRGKNGSGWHANLYAFGRRSRGAYQGEGAWIQEAAGSVIGEVNSRLTKDNIRHVKKTENQVARIGRNAFRRSFGFGFR